MTHLESAQVWHVNEGSHSLQPTRLFTSGMNHTCLYFPAVEHRRTLDGTRFLSSLGREVSPSPWVMLCGREDNRRLDGALAMR